MENCPIDRVGGVARRQMIPLVWLLVLAFGMAACGTDQEDVPAAEPSPEAEEVDTDEAEDADEEAEAVDEQQELTELVILPVPTLSSAPVWMAHDQGYYEAVGLDVEMVFFPSGATALEAFRQGQGDMVMSGDIPAMTYWENQDRDLQVFMSVLRKPEGYGIAVAPEIQAPEDLEGTTIGVREGTTSDFFVSQYFRAHGLDESSVELVNLEPGQMTAALDNRDIQSFFIWEPFAGQAVEVLGEDGVHRLDTGLGYIGGYTLFSARPEWLDANEDLVFDFIEATLRGMDFVDENVDGHLAEYALREHQQSAEIVREQYDVSDWMISYFDEDFFNEFRAMNEWAIEQGIMSETIDFDSWIWQPALEYDPRSVTP